ncbi:hypothetical protein OUZ56_015874 [Daphnia magna]|uniref:Uncharacterized protein n=1 Tax=Daphnia magna TaxID=35525 RepID=A0ABR0APG3_9CRUS|nr:hypothetical protein OUZ56_015874 [Daphnia magna]
MPSLKSNSTMPIILSSFFAIIFEISKCVRRKKMDVYNITAILVEGEVSSSIFGRAYIDIEEIIIPEKIGDPGNHCGARDYHS